MAILYNTLQSMEPILLTGRIGIYHMLRYSMLVLAVFIVSSCAGTGGKQLGLDHTSNDPAAAVENLGKPAGVDASLWYELRQALTVELERFGAHRRVASAPVSELNKVADLAVALEGNQARFSWTYRNIGDYDVRIVKFFHKHALF